MRRTILLSPAIAMYRSKATRFSKAFTRLLGQSGRWPNLKVLFVEEHNLRADPRGPHDTLFNCSHGKTCCVHVGRAPEAMRPGVHTQHHKDVEDLTQCVQGFRAMNGIPYKQAWNRIRARRCAGHRSEVVDLVLRISDVSYTYDSLTSNTYR